MRRVLAALLMLAAVAAAGLVAPRPVAHAARGDAMRDRAVRWAVAQAGTRERGTTNCGPQINRWSRDMRLRVPPCRAWCGSFVHQAFLRGGTRLSARIIDPHRSYADAVAGRRGLRRIPVSEVRRGDLLFFAFRPRLDASHLAIVRERPRNGSVRTVEGNVAHAVRLERRGLRFAVLAARVEP